MIRIALFYITTVTVLFTTAVHAVEPDKLLHAVGSYGITHATQAVCNRLTEGQHKTGCLVTGIVTAGMFGAAKELNDQRKGTNTVKQSLEDGVADVVGIGLAVTFISIDF